jgi:ABC-type cobalamin/Fe3+-siderophores transport system ATPase subunit
MILEAKDVVIKYGDLVAVAGVSVALKPGEISSIIGPNGAGKSTLLRALNGYLPIADGTSSLMINPSIDLAAGQSGDT